MKKSICLLSSVAIAAGMVFSSCSSPSQKVENAQVKVEDAKSDVKDAKQDLAEAQQGTTSDFQKFKNESNQEINDNERHIAELRVEIKNEKGDVRVKDEQKVDALEKKNHELKEKLEAYHDDGKSDWQEFKKEFKHDLDGIGNAFKDITVRNTK